MEVRERKAAVRARTSAAARPVEAPGSPTPSAAEARSFFRGGGDAPPVSESEEEEAEEARVSSPRAAVVRAKGAAGEREGVGPGGERESGGRRERGSGRGREKFSPAGERERLGPGVERKSGRGERESGRSGSQGGGGPAFRSSQHGEHH